MDIQNNTAQNSLSEPIVAKSGLNWKKILIIGLVVSALGAVAYFASTTSLFSGDIFKKDFKAKNIEDFFPVEAEDFTKIKISKADSTSELLDGTWKMVISKYLQNQAAFPEDQLLKLSQGKDLEILAASWNGGKNSLVAAKLDAETLSHLAANFESENAYYASVFNADESRLIAARAAIPGGEVDPNRVVAPITASPGVSISAAALAAAAKAAEEAAAAKAAEEVAAAKAAEEAAAAKAAEEAAAAKAAEEAAAAKAAEEAAAAKAAEEAAAAKAAEEAAAKAAEEAAAAKAAEEAAAALAAAEEAKQKALCNPQKNFCIVGDYLLLGNSIELAAEITTRPATKKISANANYKKLHALLKSKKSGLFNGRDRIFLATIAEIKTYYSGTSNPATPAETSENVSEQEVIEIDKIGPQIQEIKDGIGAEKTKTETAQQQALDASVKLSDLSSDGDKYTLAAIAIYVEAHLKTSDKAKEAQSALTAMANLVISEADFKVIQTALGKAKEYALAAKTHDEAIQQLTAAQKFLTDAQAKLTDAKKQTTIAEEASLQAKEILLAAENAVQALGDAAFKKKAEEEKEVPKYLLDQWDPQDDQISGATVISFSAEALANQEYLDNMHLFAPSSNEKTDWYKMYVNADKKYTFTSNEPDKVQIDLASSSNDASCSATGTKEILATGKVVYTPKNNETVCISASTSQSDNIGYTLIYKFQNVPKVPPTQGLPPATEVKMTTSAGQQMKIAVEGTEKMEVLRVDFAGISEKVTIDELQLAIASIVKTPVFPDIPVKELFIYNSENTLLAKCTPDQYGLALCSEIGFKVDAGQKSTMIIKADLIPLSTVGSSDKVKTGTVFNVAIKSILKAYKQNPSFKANIETRAPLKCTSPFISYNSLIDVADEKFSPKCGNEIMPGDIIFVDKKEYILITDKKSTESQEIVALTHKQYGSSFFYGNTNLATNSEKLLAHGALIMFRASKPVITTEIYPDDKKISKNLAKGIYQFNLNAEKNSFSVGRIVFEVEGQLGGIKIAPASNLTDSYLVYKDHYINLKGNNGLTVASIEKFDLTYAGEDGKKLPAEFKYYYDEKVDKGYVFADLLEDLKINTSITKLELKAKITGDLTNGDYLKVKIPAVLNTSQLITNEDLNDPNWKSAGYTKNRTNTLKDNKRTRFPDFVDPDFYAAMDDAEKAKLITKFFLYDDFIWSDRDQELRSLIGTMKQFYFDTTSNFIGGYMLDSLPTAEQTLYY